MVHPLTVSSQVDETMVKFNGRIGFKQYMPRKAAKWGLKYFSLNESETGYTCAWKLFTGSQPMPPPSETTIDCAATHHPPNLPAQGKVVLDLLKGLEHKGHCISTSHLCKGVPLLTTAIRNPVSLQHQWVFQHFNEVRPHCAVLDVLYCTVHTEWL